MVPVGRLDEQTIEFRDSVVRLKEDGEADRRSIFLRDAHATFDELRGWQFDGVGMLQY